MISEPNSNFVFDKLNLSKPSSVGGGVFFMKYTFEGSPLYIKTPKCLLKSQKTSTNSTTATASTAKKTHCDFIFSRDDEEFLQWMENLENISQQKIFQNRESWFETSLEIDDIENSFTSPIRPYKSGKFYLLRANLATRMGKTVLRIYDENGNDVSIDSIGENTDVLTILEVQGIRCSTRSFQIDIELKQMMVLDKVDPFEKCVFLQKKQAVAPLSETATQSIVVVNDEVNLRATTIVKDEDEPTISKDETEPFIEEKQEEPIVVDTSLDILEQEKKGSEELQEVEFDLEKIESSGETVALKQRKDVYYEMYHEARRKAKVARDLALSAYLEAKRIKNTYMLDDIEDSDDSDMESDSESESDAESDLESEEEMAA